MNITDLKREDVAKIVSLKNISKQFMERLMDLGIYESASITLLNKLSYDNLYLIEVDDIEICLRKEDALNIEVRK
ncbi:MAG: ferrous iron transport protein A [Candidatus Izimaplasma sp.]|nr:ferrous iron transport protein A [Candidatus Izimaplasma bacterium]